MKNINQIYFLFVLLLLTTAIQAQQFPLSSHYTVNPYAINPAFAGLNNRSEFYLNYRHDWGAIEGSPRTYRMNGNRKVYNNMYLGGELMGDMADVFYRLKAGLSYTYRIQLAYNQQLSFGIAAQLYQSLIRIDQVNADLNDPMLRNLDRILSTNYNASFGLVYNLNELVIGFGMPVMARTKEAYLQTGEGIFAFERAYNFYLGNRFSIDHQWDFKPVLLARKTINQPMTVDFSGMFVYNQQFWVGGMFRNTAVFGLSAGAKVLNGLLVHYSYEFGGGSIFPQSGGSHEITLGWSKPNDDTRNIKRNPRRIDYGSYRYANTKQNQKEMKAKERKAKRQKREKNSNQRLVSPPRTPLFAPYENFK